MSGLRTIVALLDADRSRLAAAAGRLMESWRDAHAEQFDREILRTLDQLATVITKALQDADRELDRAEQALHAAGESLRG